MIPFLIQKVGLTPREAVDFFDIRECAQRTQDESVMVRKAACGALCKLLQLCPESDAVLQMWSLFVLPLVQDSEQSVSEKGLDEVERFVFQPLADWGQQEQVELGEDGIFKLLAAIGANSDALEFLLRSWRFSIKRAEAGTRPGVTGFLDAIRRAVDLVHVSSESPSSAIHCGMALWSLAEEAASVDAENIPARSALDAWRRCQDCSQDKRLVLFAVRILRIVQMKAAVLEDEVKGELAAGWLEKIPACETPALVSEMVRALEAAKPGAVAALVPDCVERITKFAIGGEAVDRIQEALFAMAEIVLQTSIGKVSDQCVTSVQTIATNTVMFEGSAVKLPEDVPEGRSACEEERGAPGAAPEGRRVLLGAQQHPPRPRGPLRHVHLSCGPLRPDDDQLSQLGVRAPPETRRDGPQSPALGGLHQVPGLDPASLHLRPLRPSGLRSRVRRGGVRARAAPPHHAARHVLRRRYHGAQRMARMQTVSRSPRERLFLAGRRARAPAARLCLPAGPHDQRDEVRRAGWDRLERALLVRRRKRRRVDGCR